MPKLIYNASRFVLQCKFDERQLAKDSGFRWDSVERYWYTKDLAAAVKLRDYAVGAAKAKLSQILLRQSPWSLPLPPIPDPYVMLPHQKAAILFALERNRSYLGLDPGLGKTLCAAVVSSALKLPTVFISPPFLVRNVEDEFKRFAPGLKVDIVRAATPKTEIDVLVVPDSLITRPAVLGGISRFIGEGEALLFVDEAHRFKNDDAKRTQALFGVKSTPGITSLFSRQVFLSGTPMPNRPVELYPVLSSAAPETIDFMGKFDYGRRYCGGHQTQFGWDFSGASNMPELARRVIAPAGPFMLRLKKELLDLPPKLEETFVVSGDMSAELKAADKKLGTRYADLEDLVKHRIAEKNNLEGTDLHVATYRRLLGVEKVKPAAEYIESILEDTADSVIVFAYHREVIDGLQAELQEWLPLVITGDTPMGERHNRVKTFQADEKRRVFIGNYLAMGTGFTLTKATRVIFVEFDWVPGVNDQASDRAHRIGQKSTVLVQYMVYADSIDRAVLDTLLRKRRVTSYV